MLDFNLLSKFTDTFAPSGKEGSLSDLIAATILPYVDTLKRDGLGNLIATVGDGSKGLICAHMDEVGFMVTEICEDGKIHFNSTGGIDPKHLASTRVLIGENRVLGVIGSKPVHFKNNVKNDIDFDSLYIDIGAESKFETEEIISIGDRISFSTNFRVMNDPEETILAKALDNRAGCFILCSLITSCAFNDGTFVFTVQEEAGLCGAACIAESQNFPFAIALDTTTSNDLPAVPDHLKISSLNKGVVMSFADGATIYNRDLILKLGKIFNENGISWQTKTKRTGGNDASALEKVGFGMTVLSLSTPCRYIHGPIGLMKRSDIESTLNATKIAFSYLKGEWNA